MVALAETITVYNKSGKAVSTSKHLVNVFKEAQSAYREKKAELKGYREGTIDHKRLLNDGKNTSKSVNSSRPAHRRRSSSVRSDRDHHRRREHREHGEHRDHHDHRRRSGSNSPKSPKAVTVTDDDQDDFEPRHIRRANTTAPAIQSTSRDLHRRHSDPDQLALAMVQNPSQLSLQDPNVDMNLAYGELPPPLPLRRTNTEGELKTKMTALTRMLEEADCLRFSAAAMIKSLEKNPDQMAAVALTLAEISNLASKLGPGALTAMRASFPAVVALLASPEFAIAIGVGVGLTVVALGGYKIIKRIQARKDAGKTDELEEIGGADGDDDAAPLAHVEAWRRGIVLEDCDDDARSVGTSVEGEFVTPGASARLQEEGLLAPKEEREREKAQKKEKKERKKKGGKDEKSDAGSKSARGSDDGRTAKKELSGLRLLFKKDK